ncbi:grip and coiled-coil domain-containing protein 2-like [Plakobranchus ocellatus]|uniref:Grip and coiled-coil domain-containing protein 2-like n=1 Tax=Plakobranchus ocellatus TaxID=259542 RepID=A0AAV4B8S3_9GAST|nr:grip and coiled-coil domain-containing protein 2-like [Plakobranchus ocellatus]
MSHPKPRKPRPLGSLRHISRTLPEKLPSIPQKLPDISPDAEHLRAGIHGNAMTVPPPQQESTRRSIEERPKSDRSLVEVKPSKSSMSSASVISHEKCEKEIKEGLLREKELKDNLSSLTNQIEELKIALKSKENENKSLIARLQNQEEESTRKLREEQASHEVTQSNLKDLQSELDQSHELNGRLSRQHAEELEKQKAEVSTRPSAKLNPMVSPETTVGKVHKSFRKLFSFFGQYDFCLLDVRFADDKGSNGVMHHQLLYFSNVC